MITLTKANERSTVHRPAYLDFVESARAASSACTRTPPTGRARPRSRSCAAASPRCSRRPASPGSHNEKALLEILDTYPRDELFQISEDELFDAAMGILHLGERQRLRLFARRDPFGRFFSLLVFVPRDRFNTRTGAIEAILRTATGATSIDYTTRVSESVLVRLHFVAYVEAGDAPTSTPTRSR